MGRTELTLIKFSPERLGETEQFETPSGKNAGLFLARAHIEAAHRPDPRPASAGLFLTRAHVEAGMSCDASISLLMVYSSRVRTLRPLANVLGWLYPFFLQDRSV